MSKPEVPISATRLRVGVILFAIWWIPIWAVVPVIMAATGSSSTSEATKLAIVMVIIQTVIGLLGAVIAGKQLMAILRKTSRKKMPKIVWKLLVSGKAEDLEPAAKP